MNKKQKNILIITLLILVVIVMFYKINTLNSEIKEINDNYKHLEDEYEEILVKEETLENEVKEEINIDTNSDISEGDTETKGTTGSLSDTMNENVYDGPNMFNASPIEHLIDDMQDVNNEPMYNEPEDITYKILD